MKDQNSIDVTETSTQKYERALDLFTESVMKPDHDLRGCAHNQGCYEQLMDIREHVLEYLKSLKKPTIKKEFEELLNMIIELVHKLNEMVRFLAVNPDNVIQIAYDLQKIERETDLKYRNLVKIIMKEIPGAKDAMLLKDAAEHIEEMADRCLSAADSITIIAIGL